MGLFDIISGKKKLAEPKDDRLFALSTAAITLETELDLKTAGKAAITYKPLSSGDFARVRTDVDQLIEAAGQSAGSLIEKQTDTYGYDWVIISDPDLEDQVTAVHAVASELTAQGFGAQLLAAAFRFEGGSNQASSNQASSNPVYWVYGFKTGSFWPFIPIPGGQTRDNATELELKAKLEKELPIEQDLTRWLGLFGAPI